MWLLWHLTEAVVSCKALYASGMHIHKQVDTLEDKVNSQCITATMYRLLA